MTYRTFWTSFFFLFFFLLLFLRFMYGKSHRFFFRFLSMFSPTTTTCHYIIISPGFTLKCGRNVTSIFILTSARIIIHLVGTSCDIDAGVQNVESHSTCRVTLVKINDYKILPAKSNNLYRGNRCRQRVFRREQEREPEWEQERGGERKWWLFAPTLRRVKDNKMEFTSTFVERIFCRDIVKGKPCTISTRTENAIKIMFACAVAYPGFFNRWWGGGWCEWKSYR